MYSYLPTLHHHFLEKHNYPHTFTLPIYKFHFLSDQLSTITALNIRLTSTLNIELDHIKSMVRLLEFCTERMYTWAQSHKMHIPELTASFQLYTTSQQSHNYLPTVAHKRWDPSFAEVDHLTQMQPTFFRITSEISVTYIYVLQKHERSLFTASSTPKSSWKKYFCRRINCNTPFYISSSQLHTSPSLSTQNKHLQKSTDHNLLPALMPWHSICSPPKHNYLNLKHRMHIFTNSSQMGALSSHLQSLLWHLLTAFL